MSKKRESAENIARKAIEDKVKNIIVQKMPLTMSAIESLIYSEMDAPSSELTITNYHKLRNYFLHRYGSQFEPVRM